MPAKAETGLKPREWLNETATAAWLLVRVQVASYPRDGLPHPDGLGTWAEHGQQATFMLEYDTGSEHLPQFAGKLTAYGHLQLRAHQPRWTRLAPSEADGRHGRPGDAVRARRDVA